MSMKRIKVAHGYNSSMGRADSYKVLVVRNSTTYHPGEILSAAIVYDLCKDSTWDVTIVPYMAAANGEV